MAGPTVKDVLLFHKIDWKVYDKFVTFCRAKPSTASKAVAFFMWLEKLSIDIIDPIKKMTDLSMMRELFAEAEAVLQCLQQNDGQSFHTDLPIITSMTGNRLDIRYFNLHKDLMMRNLVYTLDGVGRIVFDDNLYAFLSTHEKQEKAAAAIPGAVRPTLPSVLAVPFDFSPPVTSTQDDRSMFIGFDMEQPIIREEILEYFTKRWGDCIDEVFITKHIRPGDTLVFGKIVFKSPTFISLALMGDQIVKYNIKEKELYAYKYSWKFLRYL